MLILSGHAAQPHSQTPGFLVLSIPKVYNGKAKTFFFFNFDGIRNEDPRFQILSVPTTLERSGNFSQNFTTQVIGGQRIRFPIQVYDMIPSAWTPTVFGRCFRT